MPSPPPPLDLHGHDLRSSSFLVPHYLSLSPPSPSLLAALSLSQSKRSTQSDPAAVRRAFGERNERRIVTGTGAHSTSGGTLRKFVEGFLRRSFEKGAVEYSKGVFTVDLSKDCCGQNGRNGESEAGEVPVDHLTLVAKRRDFPNLPSTKLLVSSSFPPNVPSSTLSAGGVTLPITKLLQKNLQHRESSALKGAVSRSSRAARREEAEEEEERAMVERAIEESMAEKAGGEPDGEEDLAAEIARAIEESLSYSLALSSSSDSSFDLSGPDRAEEAARAAEAMERAIQASLSEDVDGDELARAIEASLGGSTPPSPPPPPPPSPPLSSVTVTSVSLRDIRFPTSFTGDGADARSSDPDYSCVYVELSATGTAHKGVGIAFCLGRGNELLLSAARLLEREVVGLSLSSCRDDFAKVWRRVVGSRDRQLLWVGVDKAVVHQAGAALVNALWDLWAKVTVQPLWRLVSTLPLDTLAKAVPLWDVEDELDEEEVRDMLSSERAGESRAARILSVESEGVPAYTTATGWSNYSNEKVEALLDEALAAGFTSFKMKVGLGLERDMGRAALIRSKIGPSNVLTMDANSVWSVHEAIFSMRALSAYNPRWIEEPLHPDDVLGHLKVQEALRPYNISVAGGEQTANRVLMKQFLSCGAYTVCQQDAVVREEEEKRGTEGKKKGDGKKETETGRGKREREEERKRERESDALRLLVPVSHFSTYMLTLHLNLPFLFPSSFFLLPSSLFLLLLLPPPSLFLLRLHLLVRKLAALTSG